MCVYFAHTIKRAERTSLYGDTWWLCSHLSSLPLYLSRRMQYNKFVVSLSHQGCCSLQQHAAAGGRNGPRRGVYRYGHAQESALAPCVASRPSLFPKELTTQDSGKKRRNAFFSEKRVCVALETQLFVHWLLSWEYEKNMNEKIVTFFISGIFLLAHGRKLVFSYFLLDHFWKFPINKSSDRKMS